MTRIELKPKLKAAFVAALFAASTVLAAACSGETSPTDVDIEAAPPEAVDGFSGTIARTKAESVPDWPTRATPSEGAPNVIVWLLDDAGFAHFEPFGGLVETPTLQRLADRGLVYTNFHSVPLCSPARAALLAGRNHHSVGMGSHIMSPAGFPGYNGEIPKSAVSWVQLLREAGYATYAFGKWDQTRVTDASVAGPFDSWPSGQGFERFYGFLGGEAHHFEPGLWTDHTPISPSEETEDYFLTTDLADKAMEYIGGLAANNPNKPFFIYWSTGAVHAPHHAPQAYIDAYKGVFDGGWDEARAQILQNQIELGIVPTGTELSPKLDEYIADWDTLGEEEQRLYARQMEAFAAQLTHADHQFGRIIDMLEATGELDNTIIIVTSDNGASAEGGMTGLHNEGLVFNSETPSLETNLRFYDAWGGPETVNHFHAGWGMAGNTPFPYFKHQVEGGGTQVPLIVSWPAGMKSRDEIRNQFHHIIDIGPTILEATGVASQETIAGVPQKPFDGISLSYTYDNEQIDTRRTLQYFEVWGNRGIYKDGWRASTIHNNIMPWERPVPGNLEDDVWRLYNVAEDFAMSRDLADQYPEKLAELQAAWEVEAQKYGVYPIDPDRRTRFIAQMNASGPKEDLIEYNPLGAVRIPEALSPPVKRKSFKIVAELEVAEGTSANGVIVTSGGITGGYAIYIRNGVANYVHNLYNEERFYVRADTAIPSGKSELEFRFIKNPDDLGGEGQFYLNGDLIGTGTIQETVRNSFSIEDGFDIGLDDGTSVTPEYEPPFKFNGKIEKVTFDLSQ